MLRAVLFVELVMAVGALFGVSSVFDWVLRLAVLTGAALPATLVVAGRGLQSASTCSPGCRRAWQYAAGVLLGALAGLYGCAMLVLAGLLEQGALAGLRRAPARRWPRRWWRRW